MNERIRELLDEAHRQTKGGIYSGHPSEWAEKFAQLIVQECCQKLEDDGMVEVAMEMKQHFGVEK